MLKKIFNAGLILVALSGLVFGTTINVPSDKATIQAGIQEAVNGDTVLVAEGIYKENIDFKGKKITVGSLFYSDGNSTHIQNTIIDGQAKGSVVKFSGSETSSSILIGFTIKNGSADYGGGIYCYNASPTLKNLVIHDNVAKYSGAGIHCYLSSPTLERVLIYNNKANETGGTGGGICCFNNSNPVLRNVTIAKNTAKSNGNDIACQYASTITIVNSIIWSEYLPDPIYIEGTGSVSATYSDIKNGTGKSYFGTGCINSDPLFVDYSGNDFHLKYNSPAIDAGNPDLDGDGTSWTDDTDDQDPDGTRLDMGVYYFVRTGIQGTITINGGSGKVVDAVVKATLTTDLSKSYTTNSDKDGKYFLQLSPGSYNVTIELTGTLIGYSSDPTVRNVVISDKLVKNVDFTLNAPPPGSIIGKVTLEGIEDVSLCTVTATSITTGYSSSSHPSNNPDHYGEYSILDLPAGAYRVSAALTGYETETDTINVTSGAPTTHNFHLQYVVVEGSISGTISLKAGSGLLTDVEIIVSNDDTTYHFPGVVDGAGHYEVTVWQGVYDVTASLDGYAPVTINDVQVVANNVKSGVNMRLINWSKITGTEFNMIEFVVVSLEGSFFTKTKSDQLAAFGSGGTSDCRGVATWMEGNHPFWENSWDIDGYWYITMVSDNNSGTDTISFKIFDTETDSIYECNEKIVFVDCQYDNSIILTIDGAIKEQKFDLVKNWNWVSFNLSPEETSLDSVFADLTDASLIYQVKNQDSSATYIGGWVGDLSDITQGEGYLIKMNDAFQDFTFRGQLINPVISTITLVQNWNWIGYLPQTALPLNTALASILGGDTIIVKNQNQSAICIGGNWIGDLTEMAPGIGYKLKITTDDSLTYLTYPLVTGAVSKPLAHKEAGSNLAGWKVMPGNKSNMIALVEPEIDAEKITDSERYTIGIFDSDGNCRSIGKKEEKCWYFTIVGNDDGESLSFKIWDAKKKCALIAEQKIQFVSDALVGAPGEPLFVKFSGAETKDVSLALPAKLVLAQNYPNPFNPVTAISYTIPEPGFVNLKIYDLKGNLVKTLVDQFQNSGNYTVEWNAGDLSSGIYFYKIQFGGQSLIKRCLLIK
ncbi:MAG TPA: carboxypeptidase regulatory-like domain-containing protein [Candidatus Marinimicrobia bacterium]|nr:carboxypeptidase regulatory-like domain-containing protein [Candidatus Neomarinimicrobiota bacterium]HRS51750.1 carboxypeptidase regulatory-like domain-containing protein [Candidatus Neomarinimicrobiota bacterium]HRU93023.1 carboxypeptidase regulatory-like domain-containing protein [Candidatus Neomarinimicrobiota bacterium]